MASDQDKEPSDHDAHSEGGDSSSEEDPTDIPGDPKLENPVMTGGRRKEILRLSLLPLRMCLKRKSSLKGLQENTKFYSQAQVHHQDDSFATQARPVVSQTLARDQIYQVQGQAQPLLDQAQASVQDQPVSQAQFPVLLPQGKGPPLPVFVCRVDLDSVYREENFL